MGFRVLFVEDSDQLSLYLDNLKVVRKDDDLIFPISDLQMVIIDNYKLVLSVQLLNKLANNNVSVIFCSIDHLPNAYILPCNGNFASSGMIEEQIKWGDEIKSSLRRKIVQAKIINQSKVLKINNLNNLSIQKLNDFASEVIDGDATNREGLAAKVYFHELFGMKFIRFNEDVINGALNYGYSIFRSLITSIIVGKGLLPNFGIFHIGKTNMFNLSDDIIEVFRPIVDNYVYQNISIYEEELTKQYKLDLIKLTTKKVKINNQYQTIKNAIEIYVESILTCIKEDNLDYFIFPDIEIKDGV